MSSHWATGYAPDDLAKAQDKYGLAFPPDLIELLLRKRPIIGYDWRTDDEQIRRALAWPADGLVFDTEHNNLWLPDWGPRPSVPSERAEVVHAAVSRAPRLIPIFGHRYLPAEPCEAGNPILSVHQSDIIYYGVDLDAYFNIEFELGAPCHHGEGAKRIRFWSDLVDRNDGDGNIFMGFDAAPRSV